MSFMTTSMCAPRIWGFNSADTEMKMARAAGWSRADLVWERLTEAGLQLWAEGHTKAALRKFRAAHVLVRLFLAKTDLRWAASHANLAIAHFHMGQQARAERHQHAALAIWRGAEAHIRQMEIRPRSRSSLFHLRMEARHRETFHDNMRVRFRRIAAETQQTLRTLTSAKPSGHRHYTRWRGERPSVFDDTRKVLGACLLIADRA